MVGETARAIRKRQPDAKIVLVTGYGPGTLPPDGEDDLVDAIIGKPFDFAQVTQTIQQVIGNRTVLGECRRLRFSVLVVAHDSGAGGEADTKATTIVGPCQESCFPASMNPVEALERFP